MILIIKSIFDSFVFVSIGDEVRTERELPPFTYFQSQSSTIFPLERETMFHLHGGIQFEYETGPLNDQLSQ